MELKAGREMDAKIAEVLGWTDRIEVSRARSLKSATEWSVAFKYRPQVKGSYEPGTYNTYVDRSGTKISCGQPHQIHFPPPFSTDDGVAFREVWPWITKHQECMGKETFWVGLDWQHKRPAVIQILAEGAYVDASMGEADTYAEAICRAAIQLHESKGESVGAGARRK